jgi:hypothetical protein
MAHCAVAAPFKEFVAGADPPLMAVMRPLRRRLRLLARSERGMALPTALFAMIASFALASVAVLSSVDAQRGTTRDSASKSAIAAADAGASVALMRLNRVRSKFNWSTRCLGPAGELQAATAGWCPKTTPETVGGATFSYQVSEFQPNSEMSVVAFGTAGGVSRRVNVKLVTKNGPPVFLTEQLIGESGIELRGGPTLKTDIGTNGNVTLVSENGKSPTICGDIRKGFGQAAPTPNPPPTCSEQGTVTEGSKTLPPVALPANIATNNSDCRLVPNCPNAGEVDFFSGTRNNEKPWDAAHRFINVPNSTTLELGGGDYWVCGLFVNGDLKMAPSRQVRIFFDTPENCPGLPSGNTQVNVTATGSVTASSFAQCETNVEECRVPGLYVMGSPTIPTTVTLTGKSGSTNQLMLYAPNSNVSIEGTASWIGLFAGKTIKMIGNATIKSDSRIPLPEQYYPGLLERTRYVECSGATGSPPDLNC